MKKLMIVAICLLLPVLVSAESIELKSGEIIEGTITERTDELIKVDTGLGIDMTYYLDEVEEIGVIIVKRVIDGCTFELGSGEKVRLAGIECPKNMPGIEESASKFVKEKIEGKKVRLEFDVQKKDEGGQLLAYVYKKTGKSNGVKWERRWGWRVVELDGELYAFINATLVDWGYARLNAGSLNMKYIELFEKYQKNAQRKGMWLWYDENKVKAETTSDAGKECLDVSDCEGGCMVVKGTDFIRDISAKISAARKVSGGVKTVEIIEMEKERNKLFEQKRNGGADGILVSGECSRWRTVSICRPIVYDGLIYVFGCP